MGGEGEGGRLGLFSFPLPGLFSSPLPGLFSPLLPGTLGLVTGASALKQTLGGHSRPEAVRTTRRRGAGGAPRRRRRAAFSRFDLPQLLLLKSTCELARAAGVGVPSGGMCKRARREISLHSREGTVGRVSIARSHYFTLHEALPLTAFARTPAAVVEPLVRGSSRELLAPGSRHSRGGLLRGSERGRRDASARVRVRGCKARRGEAQAQAQAQARRAAAARDLLLLLGVRRGRRAARLYPGGARRRCALVTHRGGSEPEQATCRMTG